MARVQTISLCLSALVAVVLLPVPDVGFDRYHFPKEFLLAATALALSVHLKVRLDAVTTWLLALVGVTLIATVGATAPLLALRGVGLTLTAATLFLAARSMNERQAWSVHWVLVVSAAAVALIALGEVFGWWAGLSSTGRAPGSTLGQRNLVAHFLLLVSPVAWALARRGTSTRQARLALLASAVLAAGIVVTRSRAAWVTSPVVLMSWVWLSRTRVLALLAVLAAAIVVATTLTPQVHWSTARPYADTLNRLVDTSSGSGRGRLEQYAATAELVRRHPWLGVGPSNWVVEYPTVAPPGDPAVNSGGFLGTGRLVNSDWLAAASEEGVLALVMVVALAVAVLRASTRSGGDASLAVPVVLALGGLGSLDAVLQLPATVAGAALILGGCARHPDDVTPRWLTWPLSALLVVVVALGASRVMGLLARTRGDFNHLEAALRWNPGDLQARFELTEALVLEGKCAQAVPHIAALRRLLPHHTQPREFARSCGVDP